MPTVVKATSLSSLSLAMHEHRRSTATFSAFPNPAHDVLFINVTGYGVHNLQIMDAAGRVVFGDRLVEGQNTVSVAGLASGTYQMVVNTMTPAR